MKKKIYLSVLALLIILSSFGLGAYAAVKYSLSVNGKAIKTDVKVINGKPYLALDSLKDLKGITIKHDPKKGTITINDAPAKTATPAAAPKPNSTPKTVDYKNVISAPSVFNYSVNSVDGVKLTWMASNISNKTIKYYTVKISTYNPVGDPSYDEMSGKSKFTLQYVGPVKPGEELVVFNLFTYQGALETIVIDEILMEYTDGTKETLKYGLKTSDSSGYE
ncbi:hypothetical protein ACFPVX_00475 [Cohnella faecalis]